MAYVVVFVVAYALGALTVLAYSKRTEIKNAAAKVKAGAEAIEADVDKLKSK